MDTVSGFSRENEMIEYIPGLIRSAYMICLGMTANTRETENLETTQPVEVFRKPHPVPSLSFGLGCPVSHL